MLIIGIVVAGSLLMADAFTAKYVSEQAALSVVKEEVKKAGQVTYTSDYRGSIVNQPVNQPVRQPVNQLNPITMRGTW